MSSRIVVMNEGVFEQIGTPNEIYYHPRTSYVATFVGNANLYKKDGKTYAIRGENIEINKGDIKATVISKSFVGGQLKISYQLEDGQVLSSNHMGMDKDVKVGDNLNIYWDEKFQVEVIDNE